MMPNSINSQISHPASSKVTAAINFLLGLWLFVSPWVYSAYGNGNAWNSWIVGGFIALFAAIRFARPHGAAGLSWVNTILAIWVFASPWIYGYEANTGRFVNSLCVGIAVFVLSIAGSSIRRSTDQAIHGH